MNVKFFSPSYKRSEKSITQSVYPFVVLVVAEREKLKYEENGNVVIACPDKVQGNVSRVRNWILDQNKDADCIVIIDDDMSSISRWQGSEKKYLKPEELIELSELATVMCTDAKVKYWGLNCVSDKGAYREHTPFSFVSYIASPISGHVKSPLRYDEELPLKEDYDLTLQHLNKYRGVLRFNAYHYEVKQAEQKGGCASYRNYDREKEQFELLQKKWGTRIVQRDRKSKRSFDFNPILKIPIRGV